MTKILAAMDNDGERIAEGATILAFDTREQAEAYVRSAYEDGLDEGETVSVQAGSFADCWLKFPHAPADGLEIGGIAYDDLIVRAPGSHPGGRFWWITPRDDVLVAVIEGS